MKKSILFLSLLFLIAASGYSQCEGDDCIEADMNFTSNDPSAHPDWQASHGSPSVSPGSIWMWSANNIGEGINYHSYNFIKGRQYCVSFDANKVVRGGGLANARAFFRVVATQGDVIGAPVTGGGSPIPSLPLVRYIITTENFNASPAPPSSANYSYTFTADNNYNNLWFYPSSSSLPVVEFSMRDLRICDITPDPCERISFNVQLSEQSSGQTAMTVIPVGVPAGSLIGMQIIKNGSTVYNGLPISYLAEPANYTICMTVKMRDGTICKKCFDLCTGKWYSKNSSGHENPDSKINTEVISKRTKLDKLFKFPEELKEKNIEKSLKENKVRIFPNPTSNNFTIEVNKNIAVSNVDIYNLVSGKRIQQLGLKNNKMNVNLTGQKAGIYNVKITLKDGSVIYKKLILK